VTSLIAETVRNYASLNNVDNDAMDDLVQNIYLDLLCNSGQKYDPTYNVKVGTYVGAVAKQHSLNVRRGKRHAVLSEAHEDGIRPMRRGSRENDPAITMELAEIRKRMEVEPDERTRTVLRAIFVDDLTLEQAGALVGISRTWAKRIVDRWVAQEKMSLAVA
jgi:RNA polymerase sigma factor (sigma-70 family)